MHTDMALAVSFRLLQVGWPPQVGWYCSTMPLASYVSRQGHAAAESSRSGRPLCRAGSKISADLEVAEAYWAAVVEVGVEELRLQVEEEAAVVEEVEEWKHS